jgi:hypothetical protein
MFFWYTELFTDKKTAAFEGGGKDEVCFKGGGKKRLQRKKKSGKG